MTPFVDDDLKRLNELMAERTLQTPETLKLYGALLSRLEAAEDVLRCAVEWHGEILTFKDEYKVWKKACGK